MATTNKNYQAFAAAVRCGRAQKILDAATAIVSTIEPPPWASEAYQLAFDLANPDGHGRRFSTDERKAKLARLTTIAGMAVA